MNNVFIMNHPLISHKISILRDKKTGVKQFRELVEEISMLIAFEATRDLPLEDVEIDTPVIERAKCKKLGGKKLTIVPILRAGLGMVEGILNLIPSAKVGHIGLARDHETLEPKEYYCNLPPDVAERPVIILDPMLATGGSACAAISFIQKRGVKNITLIGIIGAAQGLERIAKEHPDVKIYVGVVDEILNENGYIVPGLGDAGDRLMGTL